MRFSCVIIIQTSVHCPILDQNRKKLSKVNIWPKLNAQKSGEIKLLHQVVSSVALYLH